MSHKSKSTPPESESESVSLSFLLPALASIPSSSSVSLSPSLIVKWLSSVRNSEETALCLRGVSNKSSVFIFVHISFVGEKMFCCLSYDNGQEYKMPLPWQLASPHNWGLRFSTLE